MGGEIVPAQGGVLFLTPWVARRQRRTDMTAGRLTHGCLGNPALSILSLRLFLCPWLLVAYFGSGNNWLDILL